MTRDDFWVLIEKANADEAAMERTLAVLEPDEIDPNGDAQLAEDSAEVTNGDDAAARRAERRRQQRAKRKHGRP